MDNTGQQKLAPTAKSSRRVLLCLAALAACGGDHDDIDRVAGSPDFPPIALTRVADGFIEPVQVTHAGDGSGRLFVSERAGRIRVVRAGAVSPTPFLDLSANVRTTDVEQGLLAIAFPPDFADRGHFYVHYTGLTGVGDTVLARYGTTAGGDLADPASGVTLLTVVQPFVNHNGGQLAFSPDGLLYMGLGDGGSGGDPLGNAQNPTALLGKILRLDVGFGPDPATPYAIPPGNPFGSEVWALGLRNPWRFSFDRANGDLYIGDVGQGQYEEIDVQAAASPGGANYGWNLMEGLHCFTGPTCSTSGLTLPVTEYAHGAGDCSVTGGFVYRAAEYPALQGLYFYADFCSGRIWALRRNGTAWESGLVLDSDLLISSFGEDEAGNLYVTDFAGGALYKIDAR